MGTWFLTMKPKQYNGKGRATDAGLTGWLQVEEGKESLIYHLHTTQVQGYQRPQHKSRYTESNRTKSGA